MPWLPDFVNAVELARRQTRAAGQSDPVTGYVAALQQGDTRGLETVWPGTVVVEDPHAGRVTGHRQLKAFVKASKQRLAPFQPQFETVASTAVDGLAVVELLAHMSRGSDVIDWPIAIVADSPDDRSVTFRSYFSPFYTEDPRRSPILASQQIGLPDVVSGFLEALDAGDPKAAAASFIPTGYLRESELQPRSHHGTEELRTYFTEQFGDDGSIGLQPCCVTDDGVRCVVEFNCSRWGNQELPPQAGIGVHERGADGLLTAVRVYHDIGPP